MNYLHIMVLIGAGIIVLLCIGGMVGGIIDNLKIKWPWNE